MIIHRLKLYNFGVYGEQEFDLTPQPSNKFNRPIILIRGKNGAGKTTIIEAIRLCLHGSLALGDRVSRSAYEDHLAKRIHVNPKSDSDVSVAKVKLSLEYVSGGQKKYYEVTREWSVVQGNVREYVHIQEDGEDLSELETRDQKDSFLRELIPVSLADLFFFDGERLYTLAENGASDELLAETLKKLFGLHLVERLQNDLDIYLSRQRSNGAQAALQDQLYELSQEISDLQTKRDRLQTDLRDNKKSRDKVHKAIKRQEQKIATEGGWFAERLENLKLRRKQLEAKIDMQRRRAQELASGLMPFAVAPRVCLKVAERLHLEAEYERRQAARRVLDNQLAQVSDSLMSSGFWEGTRVRDENLRREILNRVTSALKRAIPHPDVEEEVILHVSEQDRRTLLNWIEQSLRQIPQEFCQTIDFLNDLEQEMQQVNEEMKMVPADETLEPLVKRLLQYNRDLGILQKTAEDLEEKIENMDFKLEQMGHQRERLREQILEKKHNNQRIQLAGRTQRALQEYSRDLRQEKVSLLEKQLVDCFNKLCRKQDLMDLVEIDSETFTMTLYRQDQPFDFEQLSAGERQLLAMATMWALRKISGVPMPVIIDTPLGRLDSDHRFSVAKYYFPQVSHQTILLATDMEVDGQMLNWLVPVVSRAYYLDYDPARSETFIRQDVCVDIPVEDKEVF